MKKKLCALLAFSMLLVGCKSNGRQIDASYDVDVYKDYMTMDNRVDSLNYLVTDKEKNLSLLGNLIDGLVETDRYGNLKPALAQDVGSASEKNKVWDFSIRGDVAWVDSNGKPTGYNVTADDFLTGIEYVLDKDHASKYQKQVASLIKNGEKYLKGKATFDEVGIEVVNEYTIRFTLEKSCPYFNTYLLNGGFYPVSRNLLEEVGDKFATSPKTMWYNGAYYLTSYSEEAIGFKKNENYWEVGQVSFEEGTMVLVENHDEALDMFKSGDLSYSYINEMYAEQNASDIDSHMYMSAISPESYVYLFNFNSSNPNSKKAVAQDAFRQTIFYGLDTGSAYVTKEQSEESEQEASDNVSVDISVQSTIIPAGFATTDKGLDYIALGSLSSFSTKNNYDEAKMTAYQAEAIKALEKAKVALPIEIRVPVCVDNPSAMEEFRRITSHFDPNFVVFKSVGYTMKTPSEVEDGEDVKTYEYIIQSNDYEMVCAPISAENGDPSSYLGKLQAKGIVNMTYSHFNDKVYEGLCIAANKFTEVDDRLMAYAECEAYLLNKAYVIPFSLGNLSYKVSSINDYTMPSGTYGLARFKLKGIKALESALTVAERQEFQAAYQEAKNTGV